jgi:hypothetical protein
MPHPDNQELNNGHITLVKRRPEVSSDFQLLPSKKFKSSPTVLDANFRGHVPEVDAEAGAHASSNTTHSDLALVGSSPLPPRLRLPRSSLEDHHNTAGITVIK